MSGISEYLKIDKIRFSKNTKTPNVRRIKTFRGFKMVPPTRVELVTPGLGNLCSIQLSYGGMNFHANVCI